MHLVCFIMRNLSWLFPLTECRVSTSEICHACHYTIQGFAWFFSPGIVVTIQSHRSLYLWKCSLDGMNLSFKSRDLFLSPSHNIPRNGSKLALSCAGCVCMFSVDACRWRMGFIRHCAESLGDDVTFHRSRSCVAWSAGTRNSDQPAS